MMGVKERQFAPVEHLTLEELVPRDHFYRHLERVLDLSFVRELVAPSYAAAGRPSIDPVGFFKLELVMFFEGIRSERQLLRLAADRLSVRWYLGYDLAEPLPDHSSLTRIRERYGREAFRRFFEAIVERCVAAGLVWGEELYLDATKMLANAAVDSIQPRFAVAARAHLEDRFASDEGAAGPQPPAPPGEEPARSGPSAAAPGLAAAHAARHDWVAQGGRQDRARHDRAYVRPADRAVSTTDPDATHLPFRDGTRLGYQGHYLVDGGRARIILGALATPGEVPEERPALDLIGQARARWRLRPRQATGDKAYGTIAIIRALEERGVQAYVLLPDHEQATPYFGKGAFRYDAATDSYTCPGGAPLPFRRLDRARQLRVYRADPATCAACPLRAHCTASPHGREVSRHYDEDFRDRVRAYQGTAAYHKARRKRGGGSSRSSPRPRTGTGCGAAGCAACGG
jgi:transposase